MTSLGDHNNTPAFAELPIAFHAHPKPPLVEEALLWSVISTSVSDCLTSVRVKGQYQPHAQGLLLSQNGGSEKPLAKAAEILQGSWSILSRDTG